MSAKIAMRSGSLATLIQYADWQMQRGLTMTDKAYGVIAKALEQFETDEFDSVAVVMMSSKGTAYFDSATVNRLEMGSLLRIMESDMLEPIRQRMRKQDEEAEKEGSE